MTGFVMCGKPQFIGEWVKLGDVAKIRTGKLDANAADEDGLYPFFTCAEKTLRINTAAYDCECVLVAGNGDLNVKYFNGKFNAYQRTYIIESKGDKELHVPYLYRFLSHYVKTLRKESIGGVIKYIKLGSLTGARLQLPSMEQQMAICGVLDSIDRVDRYCLKELDRLDKLVKSRFIEMFGDALNSDNRWPERTLGSMLDIARGGSPRPIKSYLTSDPAGINWIKIGDAVNGSRYIENTAERIKPSGAKKSRLVHSGDFLLSNSMSFGRPYILKTEGCIHDGWLVLQGVDGCFDSLFLYQLLASDDMLHRFRGLVRGGVVNNLNKDLVSSVSVMVPPIGLQRDFATFVQQVDKLRFMLLGNPSPMFGHRSFCCSTNSGNGGVILEAKEY